MFLGAVPVAASITITVVWNPVPSSPVITGSALTLIHEDNDTVLGPFVADEDALNTYSYQISEGVPRGGRWRVRWATTPPGGVTNDVIYAQ